MQDTPPLPTTLADLVARTRAGERFEFLPFWGHQVPADGSVAASCLSQWYPAPFELDGVRYPTAEHFMMAEKARLSDDRGTLARILAAPSPAAAKKLGRLVEGYDDARWDAVRYDAVVRGNRAKFGQDRRLREFLLRTGRRVLVEASPVDRIWGIGMAAADPRAGSPELWRGHNLLGFALVQVRDEFVRSTPGLPEAAA